MLKWSLAPALLTLDPVYLSRLQFAFTIMFHYLFPPLTIGMGVVLVYLEGMFLRAQHFQQQDRWLEALDGERGAAVDVRSRLERIRGVVCIVDRMAMRFLKGGALGALGLRALVRASRAGRHR